MDEKEWKEFQKKVEEASIGEKTIGVNFFSKTIIINFVKKDSVDE